MPQFIDQAHSYEPAVTPFSFLAQTAAPAPAPVGATSADAQGGGSGMLLTMGLMMIGVYFLFIAPQMKKQKEQQKLIEGLKTGHEIVTSGGIHGVVTQVKEDRFVVEIAKNTRVEIQKAHVLARVSAPDEKPASDKATPA